jgi:hypothetical protein
MKTKSTAEAAESAKKNGLASSSRSWRLGGNQLTRDLPRHEASNMLGF